MNFQEMQNLVVDFIGMEYRNRVGYFINVGQKVLERKLRLSAMMYYPDVTALASGVNSFSVPTDYIEMIYFSIVDDTTRFPITELDSDKSMIEFDRSHKEDSTNTGRPTRMRRAGSLFEFNRYTDNADYSYEWAYYRNLTALSDNSDTNWWTTNAEDALLYAALVESIPFLTLNIKEARKIKAWAIIRDEKIKELQTSNSKEKLSGGRKRTRYFD